MIEKGTATQLAPVTTSVKLVEPGILLDRINRIHEGIERRAFEIFQNNGGVPGRELDDWFKAEEELLHPVHMNLAESDGALTVAVEIPGFGADQPADEPRPWICARTRLARAEIPMRSTRLDYERPLRLLHRDFRWFFRRLFRAGFFVILKIGIQDVLREHSLRIEERTIQRNRVPHNFRVRISALIEHRKNREFEFFVHGGHFAGVQL